MGYDPMYMLHVRCRRRFWYLASVYRDIVSPSLDALHAMPLCQTFRATKPRIARQMDALLGSLSAFAAS